MSGRAVIDASAAVDVLQRNERAGRVETVLAGYDLAAPAHIDVEVLSALHRGVRSGADTMTQMLMRLSLWRSWPIERAGIADLLPSATVMAASVAIPDTFYIALAEHLDAPLITCDRGMAASSHRAILVS